MSLIERVNEKSIYIRCICGEGYNNPLNDWTSKKLTDLGAGYEPFRSEPCPNCGMQHFFNMQLTPTQYEEQELEEMPFFPKGETEQREQVRALMWKVREDLKGKDQAAANEAAKAALEKKHGKPFEEIVAEQVEKTARRRNPQTTAENIVENA